VAYMLPRVGVRSRAACSRGSLATTDCLYGLACKWAPAGTVLLASAVMSSLESFLGSKSVFPTCVVKELARWKQIAGS
jgi:hypothetical protein